jgi:hypothetical protein
MVPTKTFRFAVLLSALLLLFSASAFADLTDVVVTQLPWGVNTDLTNMAEVFGAGNFTAYLSYAAADPTAIFSASNKFVFLEGGDGTDADWAAYVSANASSILSWVNNGGALLLQSAAWTGRGDVTLGPGTITGGQTALSSCGTLTAAGVAAFNFVATPTNQCGGFISHDNITGGGLTVFMNADLNNLPNVAGTAFGAGYIMYSALTDSEFHNAGTGLVDDEIAFTAKQATAVPEPSAILLLGAAIALSGLLRRRLL